MKIAEICRLLIQRRMTKPDWALLRAFHATASLGSLSAAGRALGLTQPTLSRQVAELERALGVALFTRAGRRLALTAAGEALLPHAAAMDQAAADLALAATGRTDQIEGTVTISLTDVFAAWVFPPLAGQIMQDAPGLVMRLVVTDALSDLHRAEADIALRHGPPNRPGLTGRRLPDSTAHVYASEGWVARHGQPATAADLGRSGLIAVEDLAGFARHMAGAGIPVAAETVRLVASTGVAIWELARQGLGPAVMLDEVAARTPGMVRLFPAHAPIRVPLWLITHRDVATSRRIRRVMDRLELGLARR